MEAWPKLHVEVFETTKVVQGKLRWSHIRDSATLLPIYRGLHVPFLWEQIKKMNFKLLVDFTEHWYDSNVSIFDAQFETVTSTSIYLTTHWIIDDKAPGLTRIERHVDTLGPVCPPELFKKSTKPKLAIKLWFRVAEQKELQIEKWEKIYF